jgi:hypothetical protein
LVPAPPVAAMLRSRAALSDAALITLLVAALPAAPRFAGAVAAEFVLLATLSGGAGATRGTERAAERCVGGGKPDLSIAARVVETEFASTASTTTARLVGVGAAGSLATQRVAVEAPRVVDLVDTLPVFADLAFRSVALLPILGRVRFALS